eukprot:9993236-Alexandrium_andersonii.AAC.1
MPQWLCRVHETSGAGMSVDPCHVPAREVQAASCVLQGPRAQPESAYGAGLQDALPGGEMRTSAT